MKKEFILKDITELQSFAKKHRVKYSDNMTKYDLFIGVLPSVLKSYHKEDLCDIIKANGLTVSPKLTKTDIIAGIIEEIEKLFKDAENDEVFLARELSDETSVLSDSPKKELVPYKEKIKTYVESIKNDENLSSNNSVALNISSSAENLKKYLAYLISMESEIYFLTEYLAELQFKSDVYQEISKRKQQKINKNAKQQIVYKTYNILGEIESLKAKEEWRDEDISKENSSEANFYLFGLNKPKKPNVVPPEIPQKPEKPKNYFIQMPTEPKYQNPGFFNKKRVLRQNEELRIEYQKKVRQYYQTIHQNELASKLYEENLVKYHKDAETYDSRVEAYKKTISQYKDEFALYKEARNTAIQKAIEERKATTEKIKADVLSSAKKYASQLPEFKTIDFLSEEKKQAKSKLKEVVVARNKLYSINVIYEKYRNYVALTSIYEYLESGRCCSLSGTDGAYNLFESELRSNEIISQLSQIATSLESIKRNQFMLYQELKSVSSNLNKMNNTLYNAIDELISIKNETRNMNSNLESMSSKLESIETNSVIATKKLTDIATNSARTAHNTAVAAHYSKVNAELTNALGFMVALK